MDFNIGDKVWVKYRGQVGYIIGKDGMHYQVSINDGEIVDLYTKDELEKCTL